MVFPFVPRLVVAKEEFPRIFQDSPVVDAEEKNRGTIYFPGVSVDMAQFRQTISKVLCDIPEHVRATPEGIARLYAELPSRTASFAAELPSQLAHLPGTVISLAVDGTGSVLQTTVNVFKDVGSLPKRANHKWRNLILLVLVLMVATPLAGVSVLFVPLENVNAGAAANRVFLYGVAPVYQAIMVAPWICTINFLLPDGGVPVHANILALTAAVLLGLAYNALFTESILFKHPVFPIPFSMLGSCLVGTFPVQPILWCLTPKTGQGVWMKTGLLLVELWLAFAAAIFWAVAVQRTSGNRAWSIALSIVNPLLRFVFKIILISPVSVALNRNRWIFIGLVVDVFYIAVSVATLPLMDDRWSMLLPFLVDTFSLTWRFYNGLDRVQCAIMSFTEVSDKEVRRHLGIQSVRKAVRLITRNCIRAPVSQIAIINLSLRDKDLKPETKVMRTLTGDSLVTFNENECYIDGEDETSFRKSRGISIDLGDGETATANQEVITIEAACAMIDDGDSDSESICPEGSSLRGTEIARSSGNIFRTETRPPSVGTEALPPSGEEGRAGGDSMDAEVGGIATGTSVEEKDEEAWEQRFLFQVIEGIAQLDLTIIIRFSIQLTVVFSKIASSISNHWNESFRFTEEHFKEAVTYGWIHIGLLFLLVFVVDRCSYFRSLQEALHPRKLSFARVQTYILKDHFWFFFFWLLWVGALFGECIVSHFGADFTLQFDYVKCLDRIEWPGCPTKSWKNSD
jgi:hypothetical protein